MNPRASRLGLAAAVSILFGLAGGAAAQACARACVGPARGAILRVRSRHNSPRSVNSASVSVGRAFTGPGIGPEW